MRHLSGIVLVFLLASLLATPPLCAQSTARRMIVSVVDADGAPVGGLEPADFGIHEDGAEREVLSVGPAGADRQIALLVDTSDAARPAVVEFRNALLAFIDGMHEGNQISLISFGGPPRILVGSTTNVERLRAAAGGVFALPGQAAYLLDAISQTADGFTRRQVARPVIVVLTTEGRDYSHAGSRRVLEGIAGSGAAVYSLVLRGRQTGFQGNAGVSESDIRYQLIERDIVLERGPGDSGGHRRDLLATPGIERAMADVVTELRNQYVVVYSRPDSLIPPEKVEVSVTQAGLTARGTPLREE